MRLPTGLLKCCTFWSARPTSLKLPSKSFSKLLKCSERVISSTSYHFNKLQDSKNDQESVVVRVLDPDKTLPHQQWIIRSNNQNVYLSWCRNAYICLSVSVAISMSQKCMAPLPFDAELHTGIIGVAHVLLVLSQVNMIVGSAEYLYHLFMTRNLTKISWLTAVLYTIFVLGHVYIFLDVFTGMEATDDADDV